MNHYIGVKQLKAKPMTRGEYNTLRGWTIPENEDPAEAGYLVEYLDGGKPNHQDFAGYISWSPKDVFERAYKQTDGGTFSARMMVESGELSLKLDKLKQFILSPKFTELPDIEQSDLREQCQHMQAYFDVLHSRVCRLCGNA